MCSLFCFCFCNCPQWYKVQESKSATSVMILNAFPDFTTVPFTVWEIKIFHSAKRLTFWHPLETTTSHKPVSDSCMQMLSAFINAHSKPILLEWEDRTITYISKIEICFISHNGVIRLCSIEFSLEPITISLF